MLQLYHLPIEPNCRKIRILLAEKGLECELRTEKVWERRDAFLRLNPAGDVPVFVDEDGTTIPGGQVIAEYIEEVYPKPAMLGEGAAQRAEVRRVVAWFDHKFHREVTANLVDEKILKSFLGLGSPNGAAIRAGHANIHYHLDYIAWLCDRRRWLGGDVFSLADIAAAAQLSSVDYIGDVPWDAHQGAKDWYARVKSRPSMRSILSDYISGAKPPPHYADLDF